MSRLPIFLSLAMLLVGCPSPESGSTDAPSDVQTFLDEYSQRFVELSYAADQAEWDANTHIIEGDTSIQERVEAANKAFAAYTGSVEVIETTRAFLEKRAALSDLEARQLEMVLFRAANNPQTVAETVERRIAAEAQQVQDLYGFDFQVDGESLSANDLDDILVESNDLDERLAVWEASKEVGKGLKDGLADLVALRNETAQALGYDDFFYYQVSEYGMGVEEMMELNRGFIRDVWPLYRELHTWARYPLADRYGQADVPELGHIYYYMSYTRPEVPVILRRGANRGFHEAVGTLLGKASTQKAFLIEKGLIAADSVSDEVQALLKEALDEVIFLPFSSGVMTHFERDLYAGGLSKDEYNARWWQYARDFQGMVPPLERGEEYCDAASKTHINNDPAQYYDYAISHVVLHQLHAHIATEILGQDPRNTNYFGNQEVGHFLAGILEVGNTRDWREVMQEKLGTEISAEPMLAYYEPLMDYLKNVNAGREHSLPESPGV